MRILCDLNVLMDFLEKREPHFAPADAVLELINRKSIEAVLPLHAIPTLTYLLRKTPPAGIRKTIQWLLSTFEIPTAGRQQIERALKFGMDDFEDALVVAVALESGCKYIITRNTVDFSSSPVPAIRPAQFLWLLKR